MYGRISAAPSAQLRPTASGRTWRIEFQNASGVCPDSVRPDASVIVPDTITGQRRPRSLEIRVDREQRRLGVQRVEYRLDQQQVGAAFEQRLDGLAVRRRPARRSVTLRAPGSLTSGEIDAVRLVGPSEPATKRGLSGVRAVQRSALSRAIVAAARLISRDAAFEAVVGLRDPRRRERVGLGDVGAGREIRVVDVADDVGPRQHQQVVVALEVAVMIVQAAGRRAAEVGLAEPALLDHRAPRAVEDEDALAEEAGELGGAVGLHGGQRLANGGVEGGKF